MNSTPEFTPKVRVTTTANTRDKPTQSALHQAASLKPMTCAPRWASRSMSNMTTMTAANAASMPTWERSSLTTYPNGTEQTRPVELLHGVRTAVSPSSPVFLADFPSGRRIDDLTTKLPKPGSLGGLQPKPLLRASCSKAWQA